MSGLITTGLILALAGTVSAGEILLANGGRLEGELVPETLMVSTGSGLIEVSSDQVVLLSRDELRLRDGRVIRGTLIGETVKTRTTLGEIAVNLEELQAFTAGRPAGKTFGGAAVSGLAAGAPVTAASRGVAPADTSGLSALALSTPTPGPVSAPQGGATTATLAESSVGKGPSGDGPGGLVARRFEVLTRESALYRDAFATARHVGHVVQGQIVTYLDFIDRRLRILNALIWDGGYWIKVRVADGTEGWLPASALREIR